MNRSGVHRYQKKLLASFPRQRELRKLLSNQFQRSLIPLLEDIPSLTYNDLLAAVGSPVEMAKTLLQGIALPPPPSPKKWAWIAIAGCLALLCLVIGLFSVYNTPEVGVVFPGPVATPSAIDSNAHFVVDDPFTHSDSHWQQPKGMSYSVEIYNTGKIPVDITVRYGKGHPDHTFSVPSEGTETFVVTKARSGSHRVSFMTDDGVLSGTVRVLVTKNP